MNEAPVSRPASGRSSIFVSGSGFIESSMQHVKQLWGAVKQPNILLPTLFIFLWQATPQSDSAMFFFMYVLKNNKKNENLNCTIVKCSFSIFFIMFLLLVCISGSSLDMVLGTLYFDLWGVACIGFVH